MTARIVVDAMGGDNAPDAIVEGALMAAGGLGVEVILVGQQDAIENELEGAKAPLSNRRVVRARLHNRARQEKFLAELLMPLLSKV